MKLIPEAKRPVPASLLLRYKDLISQVGSFSCFRWTAFGELVSFRFHWAFGELLPTPASICCQSIKEITRGCLGNPNPAPLLHPTPKHLFFLSSSTCPMLLSLYINVSVTACGICLVEVICLVWWSEILLGWSVCWRCRWAEVCLVGSEVGLVFRLVANGFVAEDLLLLSPCLGRSWGWWGLWWRLMVVFCGLGGLGGLGGLMVNGLWWMAHGFWWMA